MQREQVRGSAGAVIVRKVAGDDTDALRLVDDYFAELRARLGELVAPPRDELRADADSGASFVAYDRGAAVACAWVRRLAPDTAEVKRLYVAPHGRGVARALLSALENEARALGCTRMVLDTAAPLEEAASLYLRAGYAETARYNDNPYAARWFAKSLATLTMLAALASFCAIGCGRPPAPATAGSPHGKLSELSRVEGEVVLCEHKVPEKVCTKHHPELVSQFERAGDWCAPHAVPESQCLECHPDLTFEPLPKLPEGADVAFIANAGEDVPELDVHAVKGKVTVFEFYAEWCAVCRKVDGHIYKRLSSGERGLAYRKLNVVEWESPLGQRYIKDVPTLPLIVVYARDGRRFRAIYGGDLALIDRTISEAGAK